MSRLISSINGPNGNITSADPLKKGGVWPAIVVVGPDIDNSGVVFSNNVQRVIGRGDSTLFWQNKWVGNSPLSTQFSRLFALELSKECSIHYRVYTFGDGLLFN